MEELQQFIKEESEQALQGPRRFLRAHNMTIGIVGYGYVGRATSILGCQNVGVLVHDVVEVESFSGENCLYCADISDLKNSNLIFVCVPTPMEESGHCHTGIVESVVKDLQAKVGDIPIVLRSTVPVGLSKSLGVNFMPEFLTEKNWMNDVREAKDWIVGTHDSSNIDFKERMRTLFRLAHKNERIHNAPTIHFAPTGVAEMCKDMRNCFLATKVAFFNELEEFCTLKGVPYDLVKELVVLDDRITDSHTMVPGPDGKRGYGGTCFPKDMQALLAEMVDAGMTSYVVAGAIDRNTEIDRPEKDWEDDKGRAVV